MFSAWHTAYFHRVKTMPRLTEMLAPYRKGRAANGQAPAPANDPAPAPAPRAGVDPNMSRDLMNALLQFPAGTVPGARLSDLQQPPEVR